MTINSTARKWMLFISLPLALFLLLPMVACSSNSADKVEVINPNTEEERLMNSNREFLIENLPVINFVDYFLEYFLDDLNTVGCKKIVKIEGENNLDERSIQYGIKVYVVSITDSNDNIFIVDISENGYCSTILLYDENGVQTTYIESRPLY